MPKEDAIAILRFFSRNLLCKFSDISMTTIKTERTRNLGFQSKFSTMKQAKFMKNSAEKIGNNQDLLTEILLRLPTKSLIKFKCVSKQWLSLISNPQFCLSHTRHHHHHGFLEPDALLLKAENSISTEFDVVPLKHYSEVPFFDYFDDIPNINMLQSCNGLFLCKALDDDGEEVSRYFICNPTTKKFKRLSFPRNPLKNCDFHVSLAFDPLKSPYYKIIILREVSKDSSVFEIDIYSSETDYWAVTGIRFKVGEACIAFEDAVFCNGTIHWNSYGNKSLCFDVEKQCLRKMPMPTPPGRNQLETRRYFGETRGTLHLARTYHGFIALELDVHQMASDYSHWLLKHRLNLGDAMKAFPQLTLGCHPFCPGFSGACFVRSEEEHEPKVVVWVDGKIICYDFNDGAWKMVYDPGPAVKIGTRFLGDFIHLHEPTFLAYKYFENLSCI